MQDLKGKFPFPKGYGTHQSLIRVKLIIDRRPATSGDISLEIKIHSGEFVIVDHQLTLEIVPFPIKDVIPCFLVPKCIVQITYDFPQHPIPAVTEIGKEVEVSPRCIQRQMRDQE